MANASDRYQDALIQHGVELQGLSNALVLQIIETLNATERDLVNRLREDAEEIGVGAQGVYARRQAKVEEMIAAVVLLRQAAWKQLHGKLRDELVSVAKFESTFTQSSLKEAIAILEVQIGGPTASQLRRIVNQDPFHGRTLRGWTTLLQGQDLALLRQTILNAVVEGASVEELVRRVRGSRDLDFTDGALQVGRVAAANIVRTALSHVSNGAREEVFQENADIIDGLLWISTLDGRTSRICAELDGRIAPIGGKPLPPLPEGHERLDPPGRRPPAHLGGCRSIMGAWFSAVGIVGDRPFVTSTLGGRERRIDFREQARREAGSAWKGLSRSQRSARIADVRNRWAQQNIGSVPSETTFRQFFDRAPASFQREWLGPTRYRLFKQGGLEIGSFVDLQTGKQFNLDQLLQLHRPAFQRAGLI